LLFILSFVVVCIAVFVIYCRSYCRFCHSLLFVLLFFVIYVVRIAGFCSYYHLLPFVLPFFDNMNSKERQYGRHK